MTTATAGATRVAAANAQIAKNGGVSTQQSPSQVSNSISQGLSTPANVGGNPKDAPGYVPTAQPGKNLDGTPIGSTPNPATTQVTPQTANATPVTGAAQNTTQSPQPTMPSGLAGQPDLSGSTSDQAGQAINQLKAKYGKALTDITGTGTPAPASQGAANAGIKSALDSQPQPTPPTPPAVTSFLDPSTNPQLDEQTQNLREFLSPAADRQTLTDSINQLKTDKSELAGLKTELMNVKRIMAGSQQDIMDEVTKAGGTISQSLLANMTIARNRALVVQGQNLQDQIQSATDLVATDTTLVGDEKQLAQEQFTNNMSLLKYQQDNYNNQLNAAKDSIKMLLGPNMENAQAVYNSVKGTAFESRYEQILGLPSGGMAQLATTGNTAQQKAALELQGLKLDNAKKSADLNVDTPGTQAYNTNQDKLEQQYRTVLLKEVSNRSGDLGIQNSKVSQAIHLTSLLNQYKDAKGNYNVPTAQYAELAMGLANLISPSGSAESDRQAILSKTASGDLKGAIQYITGQPQNGNTQAIIKNLADSIDRQASTAEDLRNEQVNFLHGLAPTGLEQGRMDALEKNALPSYSDYKQTGKLGTTPSQPKLLAPTDIPAGYYQASDGLLYPKQQ